MVLTQKNGTIDASEEYKTSSDKIFMDGAIKFAAAFIQDDISFNQFTLQTGLRFDYAGFYNGQLIVENPTSVTAFESDIRTKFPKNDWTNLSPRIALLYNINDKHKVYASVSSGFMPPKLDDMCSSRKISAGFKVANPNLKPETIFAYEIGAHFKTIAITCN